MNGYERTKNFVLGQPVDRPPFMPLVIEWVSKQCGIEYPEFVYNPEVRANAYLEIAEKFDLDCVLPDADFSEQLEDFGQKPVWTSSGYQVKPIINDMDDIKALKLPEIKPGTRQGNRIEIIKRVAEKEKGHRYIFGICIGPFTEYCNAHSLDETLYNIGDEEYDELVEGMNLFFRNGMNFIQAQLDAGADGIQIVEPNCSLISPAFYEEYIQPLHKQMVDLIQSNGGFARLHVCGNTARIMPYLLSTGTRILDVDSAVDLTQVSHLLGEGQCFCGNLSTSEELLWGKPEIYADAVRSRCQQTNNRIILCSGCDVPADTSAENMHAFHDAVAALAK